jgi:glycine/D-amino acid oxidase-like deaminating enzyme
VKNGGHLQPLLLDGPVDVVKFELQNCEDWAAYIEKNAIECEYRAALACQTYWKKEFLPGAEEGLDKLKKEDPELAKRVRILTSADDMKKARVLPTCEGAAKINGAASLWPYKLVAWILSSLIKSSKLNLQTNTPVTGFSPAVPSVACPKARWVLHTPRGDVAAASVLLATNAYTSHLIPSMSDVIVPVRGVMTALAPPPGLRDRLPCSYGFLGLSGVLNHWSHEYLVQRPGSSGALGDLMLGGGNVPAASMPHVGESDDSVLDPAIVSYLAAAMPRALDFGGETPADLNVRMAWSGVWGASRDGMPWVGPAPGSDGVWVCGGYTGHGMPNAGGCARAVVRMMAAEQRGDSVDDVAEELARSGLLPRRYWFHDQRVERARKVADVSAQIKRGLDACKLVDDLPDIDRDIKL